MSPRPDVSQARTQQILQAAAEVFSRSGFHEARMDDIAEQAGVSKGTLYWYFESKDDLILALLDSMFQREMEQIAQLQEADLLVREKLERILDWAGDDIARMEPLMPILLEFWAMQLRRKTVRQVVGRYYVSYLELITPLIQQGIDQGEFRAVSARDVTVAIGAVIEGTIVLWAAVPERIDLKEDIRKGVCLILDALTVRGQDG